MNNTMTKDNIKITGFSINEINIITNGSPNEMKTINNTNQIGIIINKDNNDIISETTPLIMIINSKRKDWKKCVKKLVECGADPDMKIKYYNKDISARIIADTYRNGFPS